MHRWRRTAFARAVGVLGSGLLGVGLLTGAPAAQADPPKIATGWLPYWMTSPQKPMGIANATANADLLTEVSPFWFSATKGGPAGVTVGFNPNFTNAAANAAWSMAQLRAAGMSVLPAIADGSGAGTMAATLADPARRTQHVNDIVNLVLTNGYDGIDLDYEQFAFADGRPSWAATQPNWTAFVQELGAALKAQGKLLSVTIPGPCSTTNACGGTNGYWVYDMAGIAPSADRIRIMTYDFHYNAPGAIAPMGWVTATAQYAASVVPPGKVQIGIPAYARSWTIKDGTKFRLTGTCPTSGSEYRKLTAMASVTAAEIPGLLSTLGVAPAAVQWDPASQENWVEYDKAVTWTDASGVAQTCTARRVMWWVGPQGVLARTQLVGQFGLGGVAFWTIGGEDPGQWPLIRTYAQQLAPAATMVALTVPSVADHGSVVPITANVTSNGAPVSGVDASLQFQKGGADWTTVASAPLGPDGSVGFTPAITEPGRWRIYVPAATGRAEQASDPAPIEVTPVLRMRSSKTKAAKGDILTMRVSARPILARQVVVIEVKSGETWQAVGRDRVNAKGIARITFTVGRKGRKEYRAVTRAFRGYGAAASAPLVVRGR